VDPIVRRRETPARAVLAFISGGLLSGSGLLALGGALATPWLFIPSGALLLASGIVWTVRIGLGVERDRRNRSGVAHIGMGADVHDSARIEQGAVVEMGATVRAGALVRSGAVIRMGATVGQNATVESDAVVGWGATVEDGAVVQRDATVGAGATVRRAAVVSAGRHVGAGGTVHASAAQKTADASVSPAARAGASDTRARQIETWCDQLESELGRGSEALRNFLTTSDRSVSSLRETCRALHAREQMLRREVSPELLARLEKERAALQERIDAAQDEDVRASLRAAAAAIDEQREQRSLLLRNADRLEAELTRLLWTIEGIVARLVHVRSAGGVSADPEVERGLGRLQAEVSAVSESLESINEDERASLRHRVR
jgi:carbonic anhydrase/acetyltransferase-like protein (isoleucine patch superfamily)